MTVAATTTTAPRTVSPNTSSTNKYTQFVDSSLGSSHIGRTSHYQEVIDGENITIVADFTSLPGGGLNLDEIIDDL